MVCRVAGHADTGTVCDPYQRQSFPQPPQPSSYGNHAGNCTGWNRFAIFADWNRSGIYATTSCLFRFSGGSNSDLSASGRDRETFPSTKTVAIESVPIFGKTLHIPCRLLVVLPLQAEYPCDGHHGFCLLKEMKMICETSTNKLLFVACGHLSAGAGWVAGCHWGCAARKRSNLSCKSAFRPLPTHRGGPSEGNALAQFSRLSPGPTGILSAS